MGVRLPSPKKVYNVGFYFYSIARHPLPRNVKTDKIRGKYRQSLYHFSYIKSTRHIFLKKAIVF